MPPRPRSRRRSHSCSNTTMCFATRSPASANSRFCSALSMPIALAVDAAAGVRHAEHLEHALQRAVLAVHAVHQREHDVDRAAARRAPPAARAAAARRPTCASGTARSRRLSCICDSSGVSQRPSPRHAERHRLEPRRGPPRAARPSPTRRTPRAPPSGRRSTDAEAVTSLAHSNPSPTSSTSVSSSMPNCSFTRRCASRISAATSAARRAAQVLDEVAVLLADLRVADAVPAQPDRVDEPPRVVAVRILEGAAAVASARLRRQPRRSSSATRDQSARRRRRAAAPARPTARRTPSQSPRVKMLVRYANPSSAFVIVSRRVAAVQHRRREQHVRERAAVRAGVVDHRAAQRARDPRRPLDPRVPLARHLPRQRRERRPGLRPHDELVVRRRPRRRACDGLSSPRCSGSPATPSPGCRSRRRGSRGRR